MKLVLGVKSDPIEYRCSFPWLFRLMAEEQVTSLQLGSFFELYQLPDSYFVRLKKQAGDCGITIDSLFTAHRELGGFFREDPEWIGVARRNYERFIEVGALLGAKSVGSNPGAVPRDLMGLKPAGVACYLKHMKELMHFAQQRGVEWLTVEPMSCLAEPPTLPDEIRAMGAELARYHEENATTTARIGYCTDIAHGYLDAQGVQRHDHLELFKSTLPWLYEVHLKNTDTRYNSTFGFQPESLDRGIVDVAACRQLILQNASVIPVEELHCYLEIGGPKLGRDYSDGQLEEQLRASLRHLKTHFLASSADAPVAVAPTVSVTGESNPIEIAPSMMCVDPLNFERALRRVEALGVDLLHIDIMDAHFVPNLPVGLETVRQLRARTRLPIDVHLMVTDADFFIEQMRTWGIDRISVHFEACPKPGRTLALIRATGARAGLALNPATPLTALDGNLEHLDHVLVMTVNPGFAGQKLVPGSLEKIAACRRRLDALGRPDLPIQVDGNVSFEHIPGMVTAGAQCLVAGTSSIFHASGSWVENLQRTRDAIRTGLARRL
jgi:ribulose-phosphate 3-epimerase